MFFLFFTINAQDNFLFLKSNRFLKIELDYSTAKIGGWESADFFLQKNDREPNYEYLYKKRMLDVFIDFCNRKLPYNCKLVKDYDTNLIMIVKFKTIDLNGTTRAIILIKKIDTNEVLANIEMYAKGGRWNTFLYLSEYAMKYLGENTGKYIEKKVRRQDEYYYN